MTGMRYSSTTLTKPSTGEEFLAAGEQILGGQAGGLQAHAGVEHQVAVAVLQGGLAEQRRFAALFIIIPHHQGVRGLAGAHSAVAEIEFCHTPILS